MKKTICLISGVIFLFGCASLPKNKTPVDDSIVKLHKAKEIQCSFTKGVGIILTEEGELEVEQSENDENDGFEFLPLLLKINPKSYNATINYIEDAETQITFNSKVQRWNESISFILDVDGLFIATIVVFNADDKFSDYEATLSWFIDDGPAIGNFWGSCKVIE